MNNEMSDAMKRLMAVFLIQKKLIEELQKDKNYGILTEVDRTYSDMGQAANDPINH